MVISIFILKFICWIFPAEVWWKFPSWKTKKLSADISCSRSLDASESGTSLHSPDPLASQKVWIFTAYFCVSYIFPIDQIDQCFHFHFFLDNTMASGLYLVVVIVGNSQVSCDVTIRRFSIYAPRKRRKPYETSVNWRNVMIMFYKILTDKHKKILSNENHTI